MDSRLEKQLAFALEIDKEKNIFRQAHLSSHGRAENDAEHAWHMALMVYLFREYADQPFDTSRAMLMCLIHDLVEIDAGDTYAYDEEAKKSQQMREEAAKERLFSMLPEDQGQELRSLFEEFEQGESPEARFARAMDNLQPLILNHSNGGSDWREHGVNADQVFARQEGTRRGSAVLWDLTEKILLEHVRTGDLKPGKVHGKESR